MGFLKRFFRNVTTEEARLRGDSSFERLTEDEIEAHLRVAQYGSFALTEAVRPSFDLQVVPSEGYRHDFYKDEESGTSVPVLMASASSEHVFDVFLELLDPLGPVVDVVLETSHDPEKRGHTDLYREHIDMPVLKSTLWEYEELLKNDGCTGVAVLNPNAPLEVQFDEHKLLIMYGDNLGEFEHVFRRENISCNEEIKFITEGEHVHSSSDEFCRAFEELTTRLGMDSMFT